MTETHRSNHIDMLNGSLFDKLLVFALPLALSSVLQQLFNAVDMAVVGKFASSQAMAAVGSNAAVVNLMINLFIGIAVGVNVVIANYIGRKEDKRIKKTVHTVIIFAVFMGVLLLILGQIIARPLLTVMNTPDDTIGLAILYLRIYFLGIPFILFYNFGAAILTSTGDTKRPLYCLIFSGIINTLLNLLLVIVFHMSVAGVAIATVISNIISAGMVLRFLKQEAEPFRFALAELHIDKTELGNVLRAGVPVGLQSMVFSITGIFIQTSLNGFGSEAVAGAAAALNFESFTYFFISAFSNAAVTFTSQNYGAKKIARCKKIYKESLIACIAICALMGILFVVGRRFLIGLFTSDPLVMKYAYIRMMRVLPFEWAACLFGIGGAFLRGIGYNITPTVLTILGSSGFQLLWVLTVCRYYTSYEVLSSVYPVSWVLTGIVVTIALIVMSRRRFSSMTAEISPSR